MNKFKNNRRTINFSRELVDSMFPLENRIDVKKDVPHMDERIVITRDSKGMPHIKAESLGGGYFGLGYMHGYDRAFQLWFTKILMEGRVSEHFGDREELINIDKYFRRLKLNKPIDSEDRDIEEDKRELIRSYIAGIEYFRKENDLPIEFKLTGVKPSPWELRDCLGVLRLMSYVGLAEGQGAAELVLTEAVMSGEKYFDALARVFEPYFKGYKYEWFKNINLPNPLLKVEKGRVPSSDSVSVGASNNWAVSGKLSETSKPIFCNDPHLEVSRLPSIWYEVVLDTPEVWCHGITVPGAPGFAAGWNGDLAWGITFTSADTEDFFIEECRNGSYLRDNKWFQFRERKEMIKTKKGRVISYSVYENDHGFLLGDPNVEGRYLARKWSGFEPVAGRVLNAFMELPLLKTVRDAMKNARKMVIPSLNWVFADSKDNIGFQMTGNIPKRKRGLSGILPIPGWDSKYGWDGYVASDKLPSLYNPEEGYIITANNRLDGGMKGSLQNMPFSIDRAARIAELIEKLKPLNAEKMKEIQMDVRSLQAKRVIDFTAEYLKGDPLGDRLLGWDCKFTPESVEATIFDDYYRELFIESTGDVLFPRELLIKIYDETLFFLLNHHLVEDEWMKENGLFSGLDWRVIVKKALDRIRGNKFVPWGKRNSIVMRHMLFGETLLGKLGFNEKPHPLRGYKTTIHQGTKYREGKRDMTFGPSYRLIVDLGKRFAYSVIPGGVSGRRFSKYYKSEINDWLCGGYKRTDFDGKKL